MFSASASRCTPSGSSRRRRSASPLLEPLSTTTISSACKPSPMSARTQRSVISARFQLRTTAVVTPASGCDRLSEHLLDAPHVVLPAELLGASEQPFTRAAQPHRPFDEPLDCSQQLLWVAGAECSRFGRLGKPTALTHHGREAAHGSLDSNEGCG